MEGDSDSAQFPTIIRRDDRWEGEDEDDDVKDNWDDEDVDNSETSETVVAVPKKKPLAQRIKEKEEKKRKEMEEKLKNLEQKEKTQEEIIAEKLERQRLQEESDLILAQEAFGVKDSKHGGVLDSLQLNDKDDLEKFRMALVDRLMVVEKSPDFVTFLENTFRDLCVSLDVEDIKKISVSLNALWNEKLKAQKGTKTKKKPGGKTGLKIERNAMKIDLDEDFATEFDEFM
ncbi:eukaryotic translation initiation factor 3 subunit j [Brevipalpus obovatus]|uniref:eukaryotic translation initiation factor 3 subunit j n=1 Tax=Brevipalpus obovatus TaxID=246614 RepID=UPI003D9E62C2